MKRHILAAIVFPSLLIAQSAQSVRSQMFVRPAGQEAAAKGFPDNYQLTLIVTDKDAQPVELSVVVASPQFTASLGEPSLAFSGLLTVEDSGSIAVNYTLGWEIAVPVGNNVQFKASNMNGSVRLKLGEEIQILKAGTRTARLSIKKLDEAKPK